ncbi:zinc chelation protein SecC [Marinobacterium aestuarii]|uniref:Zinc chelation protein SecC n=1 Tax=Marinobacterium aestuarii TaxID=1821621 RepID=A0A1A9ET89_9GAMM|nr:PBPRA1643 family SWIM/SEC-C metal-binding motif protein [Marinobacterium aestuarii]ANG61374.1 zinc chelation protein SecC [Marinobacterium aestuarii]
MSDKFFFKGRQTPKPKHSSYGFNTKRAAKPGTEDSPLALSVQNEARKAEVEAMLLEHQLIATIRVDAEADENIADMLSLINTPKTVSLDAKPNRNDPCSCGSGVKYKKCCGA